MRNFLAAIIGIVALLVLISKSEIIANRDFLGKSKTERDPKILLREIYNEVKELGSYENEDFVKREFHTNLDGNNENKEEHVVVLIYKVEDRERMILQVTYFKPEKKGSIIKYPDEIRVILCYLKGDELEIKHCDYKEKEIESLLPDILEGIRNKKEILKLIEHKN